MSNSANIVRTIYQDVDAAGLVLGTSYGIRVYDDYGSTYTNLLDDLETLLHASPDSLIEMALGLDETARGIVEHAQEHRHPVWIDGVPHSPGEPWDDDDEEDDFDATEVDGNLVAVDMD